MYDIILFNKVEIKIFNRKQGKLINKTVFCTCKSVKNNKNYFLFF